MGKVGLHSLTQGIATGNDEQTTFYMVYQNTSGFVKLYGQGTPLFAYFNLQITYNVHSYICSALTCLNGEHKRKYKKILAGKIQTGGLYVYLQTRFVRADVLPNILYLLAN